MLLIVVLALSVAAYFALVQNAEFIGAKTIRTLAGEAVETYEYAKRQYNEAFDTRSTNPPVLLPSTHAAPDLSPEQTEENRNAFRNTAEERANVPKPQLRHADLKRLLLDLTNRERATHGAPALKLGNNPAAQLHVEAALEGCYSSHWDRWGLKPNHRYTLTGGAGADAENGHGLDYCIKPKDNYATNSSMEQEVAEAVQGWMNSPGHRRSLLNPAHTELNAGIAYDRYNTVFAQHFASDYVTYSQTPTIDPQGILTLSATVSGATLQIERQRQRPNRPRPATPTADQRPAQLHVLSLPTHAGGLRSETPAPWMAFQRLRDTHDDSPGRLRGPLPDSNRSSSTKQPP